jgi:hypothetical protein
MASGNIQITVKAVVWPFRIYLKWVKFKCWIVSATAIEFGDLKTKTFYLRGKMWVIALAIKHKIS